MQNTELDLKDIIDVLRRQRRLILAAFTATMGIAILYLLLATPLYRSTTLLSIDAAGANLLDPGVGETNQSAVLNSRVDGEVEILRAPSTLLAVVERADLINTTEFGPRLGVMERIGIALGIGNPIDRLRRLVGMQPLPPPSGEALIQSTIRQLNAATTVRRRGLTYLIALEVVSEDPQLAARIANIYAQTYIERQVQTKTEGAIASRDVLRRQMETARRNLADSEAALNSFIDDNLGRLEAESGDLSVAMLRQQLESAAQGRQQTSDFLNALANNTVQRDWLSLADSIGDQALAQLARERADLQRRLSGQAIGSPEAVELAAALERVEQGLDRRAMIVRGSLQGSIDEFTAQETRAREQLREALLSSNISSEIIADLFNLQQSATVARTQYQQLLARVQYLDAQANIQVADARVVSQALPSNQPDSPQRNLILAVALVAAIGIGIGLALLNEYYIGGITSQLQLRNVIQAPVPAAMPTIAGSASEEHRVADTVVTAPLSSYAEGLRKLRSSIDNFIRLKQSERPPESARKGQVVLVCSALPGEGKSTTSIGLARTYAQAGLYTLLIDCDMRKPSISNYIGVESDQGLLNYLTERSDSSDMVLTPARDPLTELQIITAGSRSDQPTDRLVNSRRFDVLMKAAIDTFDVVVIDSPPILPVVDTRYLAQHADIVVQVVRFGSTTQGEVREAASQVTEMLPPHGALIAILNRQIAPIRKRGNYAGDYYGYYTEPNSKS